MAPAPLLLLAVLAALTLGIIIALAMLGRRHPVIAISVFVSLCALAGLVVMAAFLTTPRSTNIAISGSKPPTLQLPAPARLPRIRVPGVTIGNGEIVVELPEGVVLEEDVAALLEQPWFVGGDRISVVGRAIRLQQPGKAPPDDESEARRLADEKLREARLADAKRRLMQALHGLRDSSWSELRKLGAELDRLNREDLSNLAQDLLNRKASIVADKRCAVAIGDGQIAEICVLQADIDPNEIHSLLADLKLSRRNIQIASRAKALSVPIGIALLIVAYWFLKRGTRRTGASHRPPSAGCC